MKRQFLKYHLTLAVILISMIAYAQWTQLVSPTTNHLLSVHFPDANTGYAVGLADTVYKTINAGVNWTALPVNTLILYQGFTSVRFTSIDTGYLAGWNGQLLKTNNGGITWHPLLSGVVYDLWSIFFSSPNIGYVVGDDGITGAGIILKTINGGTSWSLQTFSTYVTLSSVVFTDSLNGHIVGGNQTILRTTDGGTTWTSQLGDCQFRSVCFPSANIGYALGTGYSVMKTTNGGVTWDTLHCATNSNYSIYFTSIDTGYITSGDFGAHIIKTVDGGASWHTQYSSLNNLRSTYFTNANTGYVVGYNGTILKTTNSGGGYIGIEELTDEQEINLYPNPTSEYLTVRAEGEKIKELRVINVLGEEVLKKKLNDYTETIDVSSLAKGIYFLEVKTEKGISIKKLIKE